ncbi:MAG: hypothetical protein ACI835_001821 [Planctomycetota bacterium]|jgi:hypothetical protein
MEPTVITYLVYLAISIGLTIWVARTLYKNGRPFLVDVFHGEEPIADSVNHLLLVGFYLINLGYVCTALKVADQVGGSQESIEALSKKIGMVLLVLGAMHFGNLYVFSRMHRRQRDGDKPKRQERKALPFEALEPSLAGPNASRGDASAATVGPIPPKMRNQSEKEGQ